jgi:hypothetical protein
MPRPKRPHARPRAADTRAASQPTLDRRRTGAELRALIARFPLPGPTALAINLACIVFANGYLLWRVWHGDLSLTGLILLIVAEGLLLTMLEAAQRATVPAEHRMRYEVESISLPGRIVSWTGAVIGIGGAYLLWIVLMQETELLLAFATRLAPWRSSGLDIALGITVLFALAGLLADRSHYRRRGPPLVSTVSLEAMSRRITFVYGALVFAIPLVALLALAIGLIKRAVGERDGTTANFLGGLAVIAAFISIFFLLARSIDSGPRGWVAVYLLGKLIVESLFALLPLLARYRTGEGLAPAGATEAITSGSSSVPAQVGGGRRPAAH